MKREDVKEMLPILQAYVENKTVQRKIMGQWTDIETIKELVLHAATNEYRVKPTSNYRPFKTDEECWSEMQKHQPLGWVKDLEDPKDRINPFGMSHIVAVGVGVVTLSGVYPFDYEEAFNNLAFADGTRFGIEVEED